MVEGNHMSLAQLRVLFFVFFVSLGFTLPFLSVWLKSFQQLSGASVGWVFASGRLSSMVFSPWVGALCDRYNMHKRYLMVGLIISVLGFMISSLPPVAPWGHEGIHLINRWQFWVGFLLFFVSTLARAPIGSLLDSITLCALDLTEEGRDNYGTIRLFGSIGWGLSAVVSGLTFQLIGFAWLSLPTLIFSLIFGVVLALQKAPPVTSAVDDVVEEQDTSDADGQFVGADTIIDDGLAEDIIEDIDDGLAAEARVTVKHSFWKRYQALISNRQMLLLLLTSFFSGAGGSIVGQYLMIYMVEYFAAPGLLLGISVAMTTVVEIPLFFVSKKLLRVLGIRGLISLSFGAYIVRVLGYVALLWLGASPWFVMPLELLHGFTFAAFWAAAVARANDLAPPGLEASAQTLLGAVMNGAGSSVGAIVGGILYEETGPTVLWLSLAAVLAVVWVLFYVTYQPMDRPEHKLRKIGTKKSIPLMPTRGDVDKSSGSEEEL